MPFVILENISVVRKFTSGVTFFRLCVHCLLWC